MDAERLRDPDATVTRPWSACSTRWECAGLTVEVFASDVPQRVCSKALLRKLPSARLQTEECIFDRLVVAILHSPQCSTRQSDIATLKIQVIIRRRYGQGMTSERG